MLLYILKSSACLAIFFLFYKLFLEKENMHVFKRYYLLGSLFLSLVIPWITFTSYVAYAPMIQSSSDIVLQPELVTKELQSDLLLIILWSLYSLGVLFFGIKFYYNISNIIYKIKNNSKLKIDKFTNVLLLDLIIPHTFFNYIFLNKQKFETNQIPKEVLLHEQTHAKQKHSVDILFIEALQVVFWFNPLIYFIKHSIKLNHEFLADKAVLNHGVPLINYQQTLLIFSSNSMQPALANAINYSLIKKRFAIMKTTTTAKSIWLRNIILLPLLAILIYSFSDRVIVEKERGTQNSTHENLQNINEYQLTQVAKEINIKINKKEEILLNDEKLVTLGTLADEVEKIVKDYNPEQLAEVKAVIEIQGDIKTGLITDIKIELRNTGINSVKIISYDLKRTSRTYLLTHDKATPERIAEYNTLAKKYNELLKSKSSLRIKLKDVKRLEYIYGLMTETQKKSVEPFPNFPPPPPPAPTPNAPSIKGTTDVTPPQYSKPRKVDKDKKLDDVPPPSPLSNDAGFYKKMKYNEVLKKNKDKTATKTYTFMTEVEEIIEGVEIPEVIEVEEVQEVIEMEEEKVLEIPPPPPITLDHMIEMAKKGSEFYYEGKKISSDKAIEIIKSNKSINMQVIGHDSSKPVVKLSTKPIIVKE